MSPISHSVLTNTTLSTAKKLKTPLKASVVLLTTVILASCGSDSGSKSYYSDSTDIPTAPEAGDGGETDGGETDGGETDGGETDGGETDGGETDGGETDGGETDGGETDGGETDGGETDGGETDGGETDGGETDGGETDGGETDGGETDGGETDGGETDGGNEEALNEAIERAKKAEQEAKDAKAKAAEAEKKLQAAEQEIQDLKDKIAAGSGDTGALKKRLEEAEAKQNDLKDQIAAAEEAQAAAEEAAQEAQDALKAANDAAKIKNEPEADKSGVQALSIKAGSLGDFTITTRDFTADKNSVQARSDKASDGLLPAVNITTSSDNDADVGNGFKEYEGEANISVSLIPTAPIDLPLTYTSTYKDFGDDMRIGHIDGSAALGTNALPVNGVAVIGNATKAENMPTDGTVGYTGDATHRKLGIGNAIEFGSSVFTADFVAKNLTGKLSFKEAGDIDLTAGINGNKFSGTADANAGYATEGGFYGGDAQYLGGVYEGNGAQGTYGAKSDKQTAAEQAVKDAQAAADEAKSQAEQAAQDAADAQAELEKTQAEIDRLKDLIESGGSGDGELQAQLDEVKAKLQEAINERDAASDELNKAKNNISDIQKQLDSLGSENTALKGQLTKAQKDLEDAQKTLTSKEGEIKKQEDSLDKLQTELDQAEDAKKQAELDKQKAEADALKAQKAADAAKKLAAAEKTRADNALAEANTAKQELAEAEQKLEDAEKALAEALASGGNTEALQAEVDRRQAALDAANDKAAAAQQAAADAIAAAQKQVEDAQAALQAATDAAEAAKIKNEPEADKSGVQTINVGTTAAGLPEDFAVTTRDFDIGKDNVIARADIASNDLLPKVDVNISGEGDRALSNGFMSHNDSTSIKTSLGELPLEYTSVYKDYGDDMRIGHIDGAASLGETKIPVDGVAVVGNATKAENMPTSTPGEGGAGYTGDATYRKLGIDNAIEFGSSVFTADFVNKNLEGKLSFANAGNIALKAGINGNKFSGAEADNAGYTTEGGFYGGDAQYLGGVYEGNGAQGTYGAKSDAQTAAEQAAVDAQAKADAAQAAIAEQQAKADAAKAAAEKAQADAQKAQAALEKAQENLANAGDGESALESALERARLAEEAQQAAEEVATKAQAAEAAAKEAQAAAEKAQQTAEQAALDAKAAADKAIGDAKAEADKLVAEANTAADAAKAEAEEARAAAEKAKDDLTKANTARDEALAAKAEAEKRAKEAEDALAASKELPPAPENPEVAASSTITGVQSNNLDGHRETKRGDIVDNNTSSFDILSSRVNELDTRYASEAINLTLRNQGSDQAYNGNKDGFKVHTGKVIVPGVGQVNEAKSRDLNYTSVYNNFNEDMQIGHVYGVIDRTLYADGKLSTVYAQGKSTSAEDMKYMKELSQYNIDNKLNDGKVNYEGVATYMENGNVEGPVMGSSKFDVDFVDQQVDGSLSFAGMKDKKLKAEITGNKFAGNWNGLDTQGGFYGDDADLLGGVYSDGKGKGTYGAEKVAPPAPVDPVDPTEPTEPTGPVNPDVAPDTEMTGFQSSAFSSLKANSSTFKQFEDAIGYVAIRDDASDFTETEKITSADGIESEVPIDNRKGNNFTAFDKGVVRGDMVQPASVKDPIAVNLQANSGTVKVNAGLGSFLNPDFKYNAVYQNFDSQMQVGHVYGVINSSVVGDVSRVANVYVQGHLTAQEDIDYLKQVNDGKASYAGQATYIENIHLGDSGSFKPVEGTSSFDVDFVNNSVKGELAFDGDFKYMPEGNKIGIEATIDGNTFAGNVNGIDTAGGFYGEDAKFLGGIYQDASVEGGKGQGPGTGTKFQGTFGAEKQPAK